MNYVLTNYQVWRKFDKSFDDKHMQNVYKNHDDSNVQISFGENTTSGAQTLNRATRLISTYVRCVYMTMNSPQCSH
jgi:hypothetical protein